MLFNIITWDATPEIIDGWSVPNWYGLSWAFSFILGYQIIKMIFQKENAPKEWTDKVLFYVLIAGILGARLGHCFFYDPEYYLANPIDIFKIWEGGLASHGGAIGILIALFIYSKKVTKNSMLWILDRVVICVAIAACFIRFGNLVNHEIVGHPSDKGMSMVFTRDFENKPDAIANAYGFEKVKYEYEQQDSDSLYQEKVTCPLYKVKMNLGDVTKKEAQEFLNNLSFDYTDLNPEAQLKTNVLHVVDKSWRISKGKEGRVVQMEAYLIPRHPAQLYEAISYAVLFLILAVMYWKGNAYLNQGLLFGTFLVLLFGARFVIEFIKVKQTDITSEWSLNMGHYLSIPFVIIGLFFIFWSLTKGKGKGALKLEE